MWLFPHLDNYQPSANNKPIYQPCCQKMTQNNLEVHTSKILQNRYIFVTLYLMEAGMVLYKCLYLYLFHSTFGLLGRYSLVAYSEVLVPFARTYIIQCHAFSVIGPIVWNELPLELRLLPSDSSDTFYKSLKYVLFHWSWVGTTSE